MRIKATIVAYAFLVQYFENATIVTYAALRVLYKCVCPVTRYLVRVHKWFSQTKYDDMNGPTLTIYAVISAVMLS